MGIQEELQNTLGKEKFAILKKVVDTICENYPLHEIVIIEEHHGHYIIKYKKGERTLCSIIVKEKELNFSMRITQTESMKLENKLNEFCVAVQNAFKQTKEQDKNRTLVFAIDNNSLQELIEILAIKKRTYCSKGKINVKK